MKIERIEINNIKRKAGVYFIFNSSLELIYIGKTQDLRQRMQMHTSPNVKLRQIPIGEAFYYSFLFLASESERRFIENILIYIHRPRYNLNYENLAY
jgi:excinuclease UvrABC nuclease subunit